MMRIAGIVVVLLIVGCAAENRAPVSAKTSSPEVAAPVPADMAQNAPAVPATATPTPSSANQNAAKAGTPSAKAAAKVAVPAQPTPKKEATAPSTSKQEAAAPLDVKSLEDKLKATSAIGVFTKLSLKNQVDDLLDRFRAFHRGQRPPTLAELRQPYDLLLMKVLSLLQDDDPPLAREISASREGLWTMLSDPAKFATTVGGAS